MYVVPTIMAARDRCYFTPVLWKEQPPGSEANIHEWRLLRDRFARARQGEFNALEDLLEIYPRLTRPDTRLFASNLLGDAATDEQLESTEAFVVKSIFDPSSACELCHSLGLWGRLSAVEAILCVYDRLFPGQLAEGLPAYLSTLLESEFGPVADYPREDTLDAFIAYEKRVRAPYQNRLDELGGPRAYAFFGGPFSVQRLAERYLELLGRGPYELMMQPYLRQRFEACTGIDCSDFYKNSNLEPLTAAARLEAWLESDAPRRFEPGERYFFGHKIPRRR